MVRAPCCEKVGLKKGPWTTEEDHILTSYIQTHGYGNWRALPKRAGLLRCGKSCRLRWTNYLRPDIKRGNFTKEEEDLIINLHEKLGNKWSAIASNLPSRTDNEIKNVWHTHLKKRANHYIEEPKRKPRRPKSKTSIRVEPKPVTIATSDPSTATQTSSIPSSTPTSPGWSHCDISSSFTNETRNMGASYAFTNNESMDSSSAQDLVEFDESLLNEALSMENWDDVPMDAKATAQEQSVLNHFGGELLCSDSFCEDENIDFWLRTFMESVELHDLPEL
ncbi:uncharacterized protein A4U43_C10F19450 [Asparagus officinalis]|uniref:Uncharacterized protein n=1 Tax=Asparagus officinalis TaxID=4686 RepID=A0A5P1E8V6_ASPOF|nr:myb-related protein Myb4-like [Asparagus officinalis]ONK57376.1 uncharacterized protein A4U43_C10F19450 [Asparagus officinalis]